MRNENTYLMVIRTVTCNTKLQFLFRTKIIIAILLLIWRETPVDGSSQPKLAISWFVLDYTLRKLRINNNSTRPPCSFSTSVNGFTTCIFGDRYILSVFIDKQDRSALSKLIYLRRFRMAVRTVAYSRMLRRAKWSANKKSRFNNN